MTTGFIKENNEIPLWSTRDKNIEERLSHLRFNCDENFLTPTGTVGFDIFVVSTLLIHSIRFTSCIRVHGCMFYCISMLLLF